MDTELLGRVLSAIESERDGRFFHASELVRQLVAICDESDLAERLHRAIPERCPWEVEADLFNILVWNTADNGSNVCRTAAKWLEANDDLRRIRVALHIGAYPYSDPTELAHVLERVVTSHPEVAGRCRELMESRKSQSVARRVVRKRFPGRGYEGSDGA
jgi:hypothetical protein